MVSPLARLYPQPALSRRRLRLRLRAPSQRAGHRSPRQEIRQHRPQHQSDAGQISRGVKAKSRKDLIMLALTLKTEKPDSAPASVTAQRNVPPPHSPVHAVESVWVWDLMQCCERQSHGQKPRRKVFYARGVIARSRTLKLKPGEMPGTSATLNRKGPKDRRHLCRWGGNRPLSRKFTFYLDFAAALFQILCVVFAHNVSVRS